MTTGDLHKILDDKNRKLSIKELKKVVYELKQDVFNELIRGEIGGRIYQFYTGEQNAFQIVLDLLEHLEEGIKIPSIIKIQLDEKLPDSVMWQVVGKDKFGFISTMFCGDENTAEAELKKLQEEL